LSIPGDGKSWLRKPFVFKAGVFEHHIENPTFEKSHGRKRRACGYSHLAFEKMDKVKLRISTYSCPSVSWRGFGITKVYRLTEAHDQSPNNSMPSGRSGFQAWDESRNIGRPMT